MPPKFAQIGAPPHSTDYAWVPCHTTTTQINDLQTKNNTANLAGLECGLHACNRITVRFR